ncbi:MAG: metal ABC transporter ATP-binding protein [Deltaproteobacteria bacterium]|nr:metal ABC transporter ATP-binding protein [Deltaproteobacteria bacterium]
MTQTPAIDVNDLWFHYDKQPILQEVTFTLQRGDFLGILGPNGGGKTTLLKLLLGMEKPDRGTIRILGQAPHDAHHRVAYVPQNTSFNLDFPVSVMDVALMGRLTRAGMGRRYRREDHAIVEDALKKAGMWEYRNRPVGHLSGGQRQRVFIARALATEPEILFLDEPTASVDPEFETDLYEFLKELNQRVTIVTITHDVGVISRNVKSVACINRRLIFHEEGKITREMVDMAYQCPVDLVAHGIPHRVLPEHGRK